jgi:cytochrome c oxidase subunit 1/cytochrome c oxidase subunit I+III
LANPDRPDPIVGENTSAVILPDHNKVGILSFILSEAGFFGTLLLAYLYFYARPEAGPGPKELDVPRTLVFSVCLFASSFTFWRSEVALTKQRRGSMLGWLALTIFLWLAWEADFASGRGESAFKSVGYYWHFVDVVWVFVLLTVYILPLIR